MKGGIGGVDFWEEMMGIKGWWRNQMIRESEKKSR